MRSTIRVVLCLALLASLLGCTRASERDYERKLTAWGLEMSDISKSVVAFSATNQAAQVSEQAGRCDRLYQEVSSVRPPARYAEVHANVLTELRHMRAAVDSTVSGNWPRVNSELQAANAAHESALVQLERIRSGAR